MKNLLILIMFLSASVFSAENSNGEISVTQLAVLQGNALDIDQWHAANFSFIS